MRVYILDKPDNKLGKMSGKMPGKMPGKKSKGIRQILTYLSKDQRVSDLAVFEDDTRLLEQVALVPPHLCLIRLGLNGIPGLKTAEEVTRIHPEIKIIFLSDDRDYALPAYDIGAYGYLLSPVSQEKFAQCFKEVYDDET